MPATFPNHYVLTVTTQNIANPTITWHNSIDIVAAAGNVPQPADAEVTAFTSWLQGLERNDSQLISMSLRNWVRGVQPFNAQAAIWTQALALVGNAYSVTGAFNPMTANGAPTLGEVCIRIQRTNFTSGGKLPNMFLRNCARANDITSVAGGHPTMVGGGGQITLAQINTWTNTKLSAYLTNNPLPRYCNVHWSAKPGAPPPFDTPIGAMVAVGPTTHNLSRKSKK